MFLAELGIVEVEKKPDLFELKEKCEKRIAELEPQIAEAKAKAIEHKRNGDTESALKAMRQMKTHQQLKEDLQKSLTEIENGILLNKA